MKKLILALAVMFVMSIGANAAWACWWDGYYGPGASYYAGWPYGGISYQRPNIYLGGAIGGTSYQKYLEETAALRSSLAADQAQLQALLAGPKPDVKQVRAVAERISRGADQLRDKAAALALPAGGAQVLAGPMGYGGGPGYGWYCW